jgi:phage shock protein C
MKPLYRSRTNRMIGGVLGGIAESYMIDANLVRLVATVLAVMSGIFPMVALYLMAWAIMPLRPVVVAAHQAP